MEKTAIKKSTVKAKIFVIITARHRRISIHMDNEEGKRSLLEKKVKNIASKQGKK